MDTGQDRDAGTFERAAPNHQRQPWAGAEGSSGCRQRKLDPFAEADATAAESARILARQRALHGSRGPAGDGGLPAQALEFADHGPGDIETGGGLDAL